MNYSNAKLSKNTVDDEQSVTVGEREEHSSAHENHLLRADVAREFAHFIVLGPENRFGPIYRQETLLEWKLCSSQKYMKTIALKLKLRFLLWLSFRV